MNEIIFCYDDKEIERDVKNEKRLQPLEFPNNVARYGYMFIVEVILCNNRGVSMKYLDEKYGVDKNNSRKTHLVRHLARNFGISLVSMNEDIFIDKNTSSELDLNPPPEVAKKIQRYQYKRKISTLEIKKIQKLHRYAILNEYIDSITDNNEYIRRSSLSIKKLIKDFEEAPLPLNEMDVICIDDYNETKEDVTVEDDSSVINKLHKYDNEQLAEAESLLTSKINLAKFKQALFYVDWTESSFYTLVVTRYIKPGLIDFMETRDIDKLLRTIKENVHNINIMVDKFAKSGNLQKKIMDICKIFQFMENTRTQLDGVNRDRGNLFLLLENLL
jgi:hypothetical protein